MPILQVQSFILCVYYKINTLIFFSFCLLLKEPLFTLCLSKVLVPVLPPKKPSQLWFVSTPRRDHAGGGVANDGDHIVVTSQPYISPHFSMV